MRKKKMVLIMGRSGSGKDYLARELEARKLKAVKSYTTRPRRHPDEDTHIFITEDEAMRLTDRAAETVIGGMQYFTTEEQIRDCDVYIIDPHGMHDIASRHPSMEFVAVYVKANPKKRMEMAVGRAFDKGREADVYRKRSAAEDAQFASFERLVEAGRHDLLPANCRDVLVVENDYCGTSMQAAADAICRKLSMESVAAHM